MEYQRVIRFMQEQPLAIRPEKLEQIIEFIRLKADGVDIPYEAAESPKSQRSAGVAILPLFGIIAQRVNMIMSFSGGTSTEKFTNDFRSLIEDPDVGAIVINVDSPGGGVFGTPELAQEIFEARGKKPVVAVANSVAASAAYWIASAAGELAVTPGGEIGSIGVYAVHRDFSEAEARDGIKSTFIKAGRLKTAGNELEPLSEEARNYLQSNVDRYYDMFTGAVARHRGVKIDDVKGGFGEGGMVGAKEAVKAGMADRVATLDETIIRMLRQISTPNGKRAVSDGPVPRAEDDINDEARRRRMAYA